MAEAVHTPIRFGTDGWRGVIADDFTFENVRHVAQAYADYVLGLGRERDGVVVGYDARFLSGRFAREAAAVLAANGVRVWLTDRVTPTPAVSWAVHERGAAGGLMITASHNPPEWNGVKIKADYGGSALPRITAAVEERLLANLRTGRAPRRADPDAVVEGGGVELFDPRPSYLRQVAGLVDLERIGRAGFRVVADAMYGAGAGYLKALLEPVGIRVVEIRGDFNPAFPGINPEPIPRNLGLLFDAVRHEKADVGLVTDGDGDRVGAVDEKGEFVDPHRIFALLLRHLVEVRGWRGSVVQTFAVTEMVGKLARRYGLPVHRTPVGFKYVCELALSEDVLIGGEESGGIGIKNHIPERDGLLCSLLLLEVMATRGQTLHEAVADLLAQVGPHFYERIDLHLPPGRRDALMETLRASPPGAFAGLPVTRVDPLDGYKFYLGEHGWILFRASGTEPIVRVYAELDDRERLRAVLAAGRAVAEGTPA
ncbi:MAG: phosphoglucomutase/phosphomannomutase family protein [Clostridia bacterium]|nr:phosphoglucomutase/phosphomannomutase family protein [Clostridia bacterium]